MTRQIFSDGAHLQTCFIADEERRKKEIEAERFKIRNYTKINKTN